MRKPITDYDKSYKLDTKTITPTLILKTGRKPKYVKRYSNLNRQSTIPLQRAQKQAITCVR